MQTYRHSLTLKVANRIMAALIKLGVPVQGSGVPTALLTVPGRKSGLPRTTPVALLADRDGDGWRLMAPYGVVDWVKNLRAAGSATITMRGRSFGVTARELSPAEGAPLLREAVASASPMLRKAFAPYFDAAPEAPLTDWEHEAGRHPVFQLTRKAPQPSPEGR
ncbi:MAG TPA: nitroreductase family deazaflavin-dependent oxidoreductase [Actinopolymorphaceae bacterium]|nr:nitroreductase family deazaflavin-dependent oxidoreductase [Actinopolymorphaceae bacterium]